MTHTAHFPDVIRTQLERMDGKASIVQLARALDLDAHGLAWELEHVGGFVNVNGYWQVSTVVAEVQAYATPYPDDEAAGDVPLSQVREDLERIVCQHPTVGTTRTTPRGHHGACDIDVFDFDGQQIALVTVYADGNVEALPVDLAQVA